MRFIQLLEETHASISRVEAWLRRFEHLLISEGKILAMSLSDLSAQVAANTSVEASAVTLLHGLSEQLSAAASDPAKVTALAAQLKSSAESLAAAIVASTPAAPATPPAPPIATTLASQASLCAREGSPSHSPKRNRRVISGVSCRP